MCLWILKQNITCLLVKRKIMWAHVVPFLLRKSTKTGVHTNGSTGTRRKPAPEVFFKLAQKRNVPKGPLYLLKR